MEDRKLVKLLVWFLPLILPLSVWAYDAETTHRAITQEAIKVFEHSYPEYKLSQEDKNLILEGSEKEDVGSRPLFHFYDPINDKGFLSHKTSKEWAQSVETQSFREHINPLMEYFSSPTDYTWERAVFEYTHRSRERGLVSLGHILHLLEDKTVPDHTRDDPHPAYLNKVFDQESPYESYSVRYDEENIDLANKLIARGQKPIILDNLNSCFDYLAKYSNKNFFSKDTILNNYNYPQIYNRNKEKTEGGVVLYGYGRFVDGKTYRLTRIIKEWDFSSGNFKEKYSLEDPGWSILDDYFAHLSEKAVLGSAGAIKLFFDEVEKEKKTLALYNKNKSLARRFTDTLSQSVNKALASVRIAFSGPSSLVGINNAKDDSSALASTTSLKLTEEKIEKVLKEEEISVYQEIEEKLAFIKREIDKLQNEIEREDFAPSKVSLVAAQGVARNFSIYSPAVEVSQNLEQATDTPQVKITAPTILEPNDLTSVFFYYFY